MKDFADTLEQRLAAMAVELVEPASESPELPRAMRSARPGRRRTSSVLGGLAATAAAMAAFFSLSGTSLADLPILKTPPTDASHIKSAVPSVAAKGVDFERAHVIRTPSGPGYVMTTADKNTVCIAIPDGAASGSFGASCSAPLSKVERSGLAAQIVGDRNTTSQATSTLAFVLPKGAEHPKLITGGVSRALSVQAGVVVTDIPSASTIVWTVDGRLQSRPFAGPFATSTGVTCPNGKGSVPSSKVPTTPGRNGEPGTIDLRALARLCR